MRRVWIILGSAVCIIALLTLSRGLGITFAPWQPPPDPLPRWITLTGEVRSNSKPVEGALVYVENLPDEPEQWPPVELQVTGDRISKSHVILRRFQKLVVNWPESETHNIRISSLTRPPRGETFRPSYEPPAVFTLDVPDHYGLTCMMSHRLAARVSVVPNRHYCLSQPDGGFELNVPGIEAGYSVKAFYPDTKTAQRKVNARKIEKVILVLE